MNICEQAETLRLLLLMGVVDKSEVISWADGIIGDQNTSPEWLLDVSLAANENIWTVDAKLCDLPGEWNRTAAAYAAMDRFAEEFQVKGNFTSHEAARILEVWAGSAKVTQEDRTAAMMPSWLVDEVSYGYATDQHIVEFIDACIAHVAAVRKAGAQT